MWIFPLLPPLILSQSSDPCFPECFLPFFPFRVHPHRFHSMPWAQMITMGLITAGTASQQVSVPCPRESQSEGVHPFPPSRSSLAQFHHIPIKSTTFIRLLAGLEIYTGRGKITHFVIVQNCFTSLSCCKNSAQCRKKEFPETEAGAEALKDGWNFGYQISDLHTQQLLLPRERVWQLQEYFC